MSTSLSISTGPVSRPSSGQKIATPDFGSPWMIAQLTALGPRWRGSSDGWYWIDPCVGVFNTGSGTNSVTNAMTIRSGRSAASSAAASSVSNESGWRTGMPASRAASASGSGGRSGLSGAQ